MGTMASQITNVSIVCSTVCSGEDQRKHQSSASLAFVMGNHQWPVDSPHKGPVTRKMFPFDDVIMILTPFFFLQMLRSPTATIEGKVHKKAFEKLEQLRAVGFFDLDTPGETNLTYLPLHALVPHIFVADLGRHCVTTYNNGLSPGATYIRSWNG